MWANNQTVAPTPMFAIIAVNLGDNFTMKGHHLSMIKDRQFDGRARANPHKHITEFIEIYGMLRYGNTNMDAIKLKLFSSSLAGHAKVWYNELSPGVITTWEEMRQAFMSRLFSPAMFDRLIGEIQSLTQLPNESLVESWLRMKDLLCSCHAHDFVILEMEEDNKVPLILGRPFLHTADAIIKVKNKELNLGVRDDRITFLIDKAMQHSHSNDDICFRMDVIDEVMEEELDALLNDSEPFLKIPEQEEEINDNFKELPLEENLRIKTSIQEPPTDLELKPLLEHLEYAFLEKDYLLPVVISALLEDDKKKRLVYVLKKHKEAFAWKTSDIPGINPSFCKHKINFKDDVKPVIQRQR
ncbi:reverse transcriptase domain-containing protein [Tanacetum coccineum]